MDTIYAQFEAGFNVPNVEKLKEAYYKTEAGQQELKTPLIDAYTGEPCPFNSGYAILELLMEGISLDELGIEFSDSACSVDEVIPVEEV